MNNLWKKNLKEIEPYIPGEQSRENDIIKLNANENPYPPSPFVVKAIKEFSFEKLRYYPDANSLNFKKAMSEFFGVGVKNIFLGNGSDDVLALAFQAFFNSRKPIAFPDVTYSFYPVWCRMFNIPFKTPMLDADFKISAEDYKEENGGVIIPNPNAPTSIGEDKEFIEKIMEYNKDCVVIIDEAYVDFGGFSSVELTKKYENLLITGTFSKSRSLAGLRIGYAIGNEALISTLEAVKNSYNSYTLNSISMAAGTESVKDVKYFKSTVSKVISTRTEVSDKLRGLGFKVMDSQTNFLFATHPQKNMKDYFEWLKAQKIYIRHFNLPRIKNYVRITIGTNREMDIFLKKTKEYLNK